MRVGLGLSPNLNDGRTPNYCYDWDRPWWQPYWYNTDKESACLAQFPGGKLPGEPGGPVIGPALPPASGSGETPFEQPNTLPGIGVDVDEEWGIEGIDWYWADPVTGVATTDSSYTPTPGTTPQKKKKGVSTETIVLAGAALMVLMMVTRR